FDILRGLAVLFMVGIHILQIYGSMEVAGSIGAGIVGFLGGPPAAPVFMFLMGALFILGKGSTSKRITRGVFLIVLGFLLNLFRGSLPVALALRLGRTTLDSIHPFTPQNLFMVVDILIFAGIALVVLAVMVRFIKRPVFWLLIGLAVTIGSPWLWGIQSGVRFLDFAFELLWGTAETTDFPAFPWLLYPITGMIYGYWSIGLGEKVSNLKTSVVLGTCALILGILLALLDLQGQFGDPSRMGFAAHLSVLGFLLLWLSGFQLLCRKTDLGLVGKGFSYLSRNITTFYVIHWLLIGWGTLLLGYNRCGWFVLLLLFCGVTVAGGFLTLAFIRIKRSLA
ncbi:MAG: acyltransferase family protein, partial [Spirochaetaceae bacterium]|nr:acyltransferase family protein [Spirochaetaceae bacterium]